MTGNQITVETLELNQQLLAYILNMFWCIFITLQMCYMCTVCGAPGGYQSEGNHSCYALNCSYSLEFGKPSDAGM